VSAPLTHRGIVPPLGFEHLLGFLVCLAVQQHPHRRHPPGVGRRVQHGPAHLLSAPVHVLAAARGQHLGATVFTRRKKQWRGLGLVVIAPTGGRRRRRRRRGGGGGGGGTVSFRVQIVVGGRDDRAAARPKRRRRFDELEASPRPALPRCACLARRDAPPSSRVTDDDAAHLLLLLRPRTMVDLQLDELGHRRLLTVCHLRTMARRYTPPGHAWHATVACTRKGVWWAGSGCLGRAGSSLTATSSAVWPSWSRACQRAPAPSSTRNIATRPSAAALQDAFVTLVLRARSSEYPRVVARTCAGACSPCSRCGRAGPPRPARAAAVPPPPAACMHARRSRPRHAPSTSGWAAAANQGHRHRENASQLSPNCLRWAGFAHPMRARGMQRALRRARRPAPATHRPPTTAAPHFLLLFLPPALLRCHRRG
jgi:hypothetical protein